MYTGSHSRLLMRPNTAKSILLLIGLCLLMPIPGAFALKSDRNQSLSIESAHWKAGQSRSGKANDPDIAHFDGNVVMTQGSMKAHANHATVYRNPSGVADANGHTGSFTRVLLTGNPAHMQQVHDGDCLLVKVDADTIDYRIASGQAILDGHVHVVQQDKGEFRGAHMIYNTDTGSMEGGDASPGSRVRMVMQPHAAEPAHARSDNCGYPGGRSKSAPSKDHS